MTRKFTVVKQNTFDELQLEAGILLKSFDPTTAEFKDEDIICATSGGIKVTCKPTYSDFGSDVDNCPSNTKEFKHLDSWETSMGFTALNVTPEIIAMSLGAADIDESTGKITPRMDLDQDDFNDIWWVGDRTDGGFAAVKQINSLSTDGLSLTSTKSGKGQLEVTLTGHVSIEDQNVVPMTFYVSEGKTA
jgi:hypothetical protein